MNDIELATVVLNRFAGKGSQQAGKLYDAEVCYRRILAILPDDFEANFQIGYIAMLAKKYDIAIEFLSKATKTNPDNALAWSQLGLAQYQNEDFEAALFSNQRSLAAVPGHVPALNNLGTLFERQGNHQIAQGYFWDAVEAARKQGVRCIEAEWNVGRMTLAEGDWQRGFARYEIRRDWEAFNLSNPWFGFPQWRGEDLTGKKLLVVYEQGLGDTIQFSRYCAELVRQYQGVNITLLVQKGLQGILRNAARRVVTELDPFYPYDFEISTMSLPYYCGTTQDNVPACTKISVSHKKVEEFAAKMECGPKLKIGIVWSGSQLYPTEHLRRIDPVKMCHILNYLPNTQLFSFQKGGQLLTEKQLLDYDVIDLGDELITWDDTAAALDNLDLLVSIPSSVFHLAAEMGKNVVMLNNVVTDWRWGLSGSNTPWYPTVLIERQTKLGDWDSVLLEVVKGLTSATT